MHAPSRIALVCCTCFAAIAGCENADDEVAKTDVRHNQPVQVSATHPLAHAAQNPAIDRSKLIVMPPLPQPAALHTVSAPSTNNSPPPPAQPPWQEVDEAKVKAAGIRKLESKRLVLYTDVPSSPEVNEFPEVFDKAFDLWCAYFGIDPAKYPTWRMRGSLMTDRSRFEAAGLIPVSLQKFFNGFTTGHEFWFYEQTSPYYRRHLMLHEGVHGFMYSLLGKNAPPWYMEGMAELLGTHRWHEGKLELPYFPKHPAEVPKLGRIEIVQNDYANKKARQLLSIMDYNGRNFFEVEPYGWSWAAAAFLNGNLNYRDRFHKLPAMLADKGDFNAKMRELFAADFSQLVEEWQVFVADIAHGYDFDRAAIDFTPGKPFTSDPAHVSVQAARGWQNTGIQLDAGKTYKLTASGSYQIAFDSKKLNCEPGGVSIHYVYGKPLGILLAAVRPQTSNIPTTVRQIETDPDQTKPNPNISPFLKPAVVGGGASITPAESGALYLKINLSAGELADASGQADVEIVEEK